MLECLRLDFQIPALLHEALALGGKMYFFTFPQKLLSLTHKNACCVFTASLFTECHLMFIC